MHTNTAAYTFQISCAGPPMAHADSELSKKEFREM